MIKKLLGAWAAAGLVNYYGQLVYVYFKTRDDEFSDIREHMFGDMTPWEIFKWYTPTDPENLSRNLVDALALVDGYRTFKMFKAYCA